MVEPYQKPMITLLKLILLSSLPRPYNELHTR